MLVQCSQCESKFEIDPKQVGFDGRKLRCSFCHGVFYINAPEEARPVGRGALPIEGMEPGEDLDGTLVLSLFNRPKCTPPPPTAKGEAARIDKETSTESGKLKRVVVPPGRKAELLFRSHWFPDDFEWDMLKTVAPYWELYRLDPSELLFKERSTSQFMVVVIKGELAITATDKDGKETRLGLVGPGESLGEVALLQPAARSCTATARMESYTFILTKGRLDQLAKDHPPLWQALVIHLTGMVCRRLRKLTGARAELLTDPRKN